MADSKVSGLTEEENPTLDDALYLVDGPGGTPTSAYTLLQSILALFVSEADSLASLDSASTPDSFVMVEDGEGVLGSAATARTFLNVEDGADVTDATNVAAAGAAMKDFGTTDQVFQNTTGRRVAIENYNGGLGDTDIRIAIYADGDDAEPMFSIGTAFGGFAPVFAFGSGGSTAPDANIARTRQGVVHVGGGAYNAIIPGRIHSNITPVGNVTTGEDILHIQTLSANALRTNGDMLRSTWYGTFANNSNAKAIRLKWGGATIFELGALPTSVAGSWVAEMTVIRTGASSQIVSIFFRCNDEVITLNTTASVNLAANLVLANSGEAVETDDIVSLAHMVDLIPGVNPS